MLRAPYIGCSFFIYQPLIYTLSLPCLSAQRPKPDALVGILFNIIKTMGDTMMPHGVHYTNGTKQGTNWAAGAGGAVVGGVVGYLWGREQRKDRCGNDYYNGCNYGGCSENTPVNRFELKQSEEMANKDAEIAYLRGQNASKDYTNDAILELRKELIARDDKQDVVTASLIQSSIDQQVNIKGLQTGLDNLATSTTRELETMATAVNREFRSINERFATERSISDCRYVAQPRVKICGKNYDFECADPAVVVASVASTVKTTK